MKRKLGPNQTSRTNESFTDQLQTWEREENPASKAAHDAETHHEHLGDADHDDGGEGVGV